MSIQLPSSHTWRSSEPGLIDFGAVMAPQQGGPAQKLNRLGNRFTIDVEGATVPTESTGRLFASKLRQALTAGAIWPVPQDGLTIGSPGSPLVNGSSQTGSSLVLKGFTAGYTVRDGQFFSIVHAGRRYLYAATADTAADGSGNMTLPINPMIRVSPSGNDVCEFATPYIEGYLSGQIAKWKVRLEGQFTDLPSFTLTEAE